MLKKRLSLILAVILIISTFSGFEKHLVSAAPKTLRLQQAKNLALANSSSYKSIKNKIALKEVSYKQAVKSLKLKKKNMSTFRWTPLLSFKFPEKADLVDESEYIYKPMQIQNEITELKHQLNDEIYAVYETTANLYTEIYGYQEVINFEEEQLAELEETLQRNRNQILLGIASEDDVKTIEQEIANLETNLAANMKKFENAKTNLTNLIKLDVTSGYVFENPYISAEIPRSQLDEIVEHTLENNHEYYSAKLDTALALLAVDVNYDLMQSQYGSKISYISSYVLQVKNGETVDGTAFRTSYDEFLKAIDEPWTGKKRILFIKIPKEWFKGAIDGVRYVEDEPYALYESSLEYLDVLQTQKDTANELEQQVRNDYETLITARTSYINLDKQVANEKENLDKSLILNSLGECTFEEYTDLRNAYEELQMEKTEALQLYTTLLHSYDRLTCGAVTAYLEAENSNMNGGSGGDSYIVEENTDVAMYYINSLIEDNMFEFGIHIPDDFETEITHYELWADNYQISTRVEIDKRIRHLMISMSDVTNFRVRVYEGDTFIDECTIDTQVYQGELSIITGYTISKNETEQNIGKYNVTYIDNSNMVEIKLDFIPEENVAYFALQNADNNFIFSAEPTSAEVPFEYLSFISGNLDNIIIKCYDSNKEFLYDAAFKSSNYSIYKIN